MGELPSKDYKQTLNLPETPFEMRAGLAQKEPVILAGWKQGALYERILAARAGAPRFVLHDGPPYANGHLHHGHILNKVLKDIVVKDRTMAGLRVDYLPGWDCHGLPIEVQVDKELGKQRAGMSKAQSRAACRAYANKFVQIQREEFERLGVLGRWNDPYLTMNYGYEAATLRQLAHFVAKNLLFKGMRPVNWCTVHQTALAEAEVEYEDHLSPSIYVAFPLLDPQRLGSHLSALDLVIWTTTPWTLPANVAICLHPEYLYVAYPVQGRLRVVAESLLAAFLAAVDAPPLEPGKIAGRWKGSELAGLIYRHPLIERQGPVIMGEHVTLEAGTGCVHTAPGHGPDDFSIGRRYGLEVLCPVDARGILTAEAGRFAGLHVDDANAPITAALQQVGALLNRLGVTTTHRYPHCWRCHRPIVFRTTEQWFVALDKPFARGGSLRQRALAAIDEVTWIPPWGRERIRGMLMTRPDWCLSRQRTWGVPIAVVYCNACGKPLLDAGLMNRVADIFETEGADAWFSRSVEELIGPCVCTSCGGQEFRREEDILDVWFDSGVSFAAALAQEGLAHEHGPGADLYLEGSDQHRGWFQSSLLCSLATSQKPPFRKVLTHGFVVDGAGKKISKSKGNFVDPFKTIKENGAELLRLWVACEDYCEDVRLSPEILSRLSETYRKVRNTVRFLLGNLADFDPQRHPLPFDQLDEFDRYALGLGVRAAVRMRQAYERFDFHVVVQTLNELCTVDLSAFYLDVLKDRLYASAKNSVERRSAQTVLWMILRDLVRLMAPILVFTAEEAWAHTPRCAGDPDSVHLALHPGLGEPPAVAELRQAAVSVDTELMERYEFVRQLRGLVNAALEVERRNKVIGSSVEAGVLMRAPASELTRLHRFGVERLADLLIVSAVRLERAAPGEALSVVVSRADGNKCARCWLYRPEVGDQQGHPNLCKRCAVALESST